jgi:ATP-binding cassette, subfamily F, member 3
MDRLHAIIADLDERLSQHGVFQRAPDKAAQTAKARATAAERLILAEEAWLEASAEIEASEG